MRKSTPSAPHAQEDVGEIKFEHKELPHGEYRDHWRRA
jgi:hypothetical protein